MRTATLAALLLCSACASSRHEPVFAAKPPGPSRPFSPYTRANGIIYLSGQIGTDSDGRVVSGGIQAETRRTMQNIRAVLEGAGSSMDKVFKCTVFIGDMKEWPAMNEVYVTYFKPDRMPSRSATGASGLALGARVEIECLAVE